jgi:metal-dependent amidase/aminoacylase/carboxypeptidase family protein
MRNPAATTAALFLLAVAGAAHAQTAPDAGLKQSIHEDFGAHLAAVFDDFHRHPELSGLETRTSARMASQLGELGYEVTTGVAGTGVVAVLQERRGPHGHDPRRHGRPAAAANSRACPIRLHRPSGRFSDGVEKPVMHACGHDVHITALIGTARQMMNAARPTGPAPWS